MNCRVMHDLRWFKYWLRVKKIRADVFGRGGSKKNPIKVRSKRNKGH